MRSLKAKYVKRKISDRLYEMEKPIIALTGGIATGKSTVTKLLQERGLTIIDADKLVKDIYKTSEAKEFVRTSFPEAFAHDEVQFPKLREIVFKDPEAKARVETFIYQRLPDAFRKASAAVTDQAFLIYDVPLLFEKALESKVDLSVVVYASRKIQKPRIMDRDGHKEELAEKILDQQMDIEEKKLRADFIIKNESSITELTAEVDQLLLQILD